MRIMKGINLNSQLVRKKKKKAPKKTITHTRQYLRGSAICLRPQSCKDFTIIREEYKNAATVFSLYLQKHGNNTHNKTLITKLRFLHKRAQKNFSRATLRPSAPWTKPQ